MEQITKYWYLEEFDLLRELPKEEIRALAEKLEMVHFHKGHEIGLKFDQEHLFFIKTGAVKLTQFKEGEYYTIDVLQKGNVYGFTGTYDPAETLVAADYSTICILSNDELVRLSNHYPKLNRVIRKIYQFRLIKLERTLKDMVSKSAKNRIGDFLIDFIKKHGNEQKNH